MAITAEQAAQLASTYQSGDTSGLQGLVNTMGVTAGDVAQYFPGFDVGSLQGISLAPTPAPAPAPTYGSQGITAQEIQDYVKANISDPAAIARASQQYDISQQNLADVFKGTYTPEQISSYFEQPAAKLYGPEQVTGNEVQAYINQYFDDPTRLAQAATQFQVKPEDIFQTYQTRGESPYTLQQIQDYLAKGTAGFTPRFQEMLGTTLGSATQQSEVEQILKEKYPNFSLTKFFDPNKFSGMSLENIEKELRDSPVNQFQDALNLSKIAKTYLGYDDTEASDLINKAFSGKLDKNSAEGQIYNALLEKNNIFGSDYEKLMTYAAVKNPEAPVFKNDPLLLKAYTPLNKKAGTTGQYEYYNDAPVLSADFALKQVGDKNQSQSNFKGGTDFGWTLNSKYGAEIKRGPALFGINFSNRDDIEKAIEFEQGLKSGAIYGAEDGYVQYGPEGSKYISAPKSDNTRQGYDPYGENTLQKLQAAATQVGLDPSKFKSAGDLYDAIEAKTNNLFLVTGRTIDWDPEVAKKLGITQTTAGRGGVNHASVLYKQIGDKLVAIAPPKTFEFHDPNTSRGFIGDFAGSIASVPFLPEIAAMATGANPAVYAAMKGAQTAALGGDVEDVLKSAGIAYLAPKVAEWAGGGIKDLLPAGTPDIIVKGASNAAANVAVNAGVAALTGKDVGDAVTNALTTSVVQTGAGQLPFIETIPEQYRAIVTRAIADVALGNDIQKALQKAIMTYGMKSGKETLKAA